MTSSRSFPKSRLAAVIGLVGLVLVGLACGQAGSGSSTSPEFAARDRDRPPVIVFGIDGADWEVIRKLWGEGRLPNLRRLADEGTSAVLKTAYGASPVIWTTIATGRTPDDHGITDFVVSTEHGTVPVSSAVRRVPALWNMSSRAGLRTALLGWWASWPAEEIEGVVVSDRAHLDLDRIVHPASDLPAFRREREQARRELPGLGGELPAPDAWVENGAFRDRIMAHEARRLNVPGFDLVLVYLRAVDIVSHRYWKYFEPDQYEGISQEDLDAYAHVIPTVYDATDEALGELLAVCPEGSLVFVVSDHGFLAGPEEHFVNLNIERLLEHLGFLVRTGESVDFARSVAYPVDSPLHARLKMIRLSLAGREPGGQVSADEAGSELDRLAQVLQSVTYEGGESVFRVRRSDLPARADLVAEVSLENPSLTVRVGSKTYRDVVKYINRISGTHTENTDGIFVAWGADLVPGAQVEGITVHDLAPTILYALGLPVAEDFAGRAWIELFTEQFRERHPVRSVPSWGTMADWQLEESPVDKQLLEELRGLGYL